MNKEQMQNLIKELIEKTTVKATQITISEDSGTNTWFSVEVDEPHFFIGRDGEALYALNHLVRRIVEGKIESTSDLGGQILIDINGF